MQAITTVNWPRTGIGSTAAAATSSNAALTLNGSDGAKSRVKRNTLSREAYDLIVRYYSTRIKRGRSISDEFSSERTGSGAFRHVPNIFCETVRLVVIAVALIHSAINTSMTANAEAQTDRRGVGVRPTEAINQWPAATKRFALIIGVDEYQDRQISRLSGASNDAKAISDALVRYAGFPRNQVILLATDQPIDRQPTRSNIIRQLSNLRQAAPKDGLLLVSFAGHGFERGGRAYLLPMDAQASEDIALLEESALNVETMRERIRQTGVQQVVIILDACRNNPASGRGATVTPLTDAYIRAFNFDIRNREVIAFATIYSTGVGQVAFEDTGRKQGYFTLALVEGLKGGAANDRGEVSLERLVAFVQETVPKRTAMGVGTQQRPFAVIEGYRASQLIMSVRSQDSAVKPDSSAQPSSPIVVKPSTDNRDDDQSTIERIEIGKSKNGTIIEGQQTDYRFDGVANSPVLFTVRAGEYVPKLTARYKAGIYDSRGRKLREPINIFHERVQEIPFTPPIDGQYIIRLKGESGRCKYTVYMDRP